MNTIKIADSMRKGNIQLNQTKRSLCLILALFFNCQNFAQSLSGVLSDSPNRELLLEGFFGFNTYPIAKTTINDFGEFFLSYSHSDMGIGYLRTIDTKPMVVILSGTNTEIRGTSLENTEGLEIIKGQENKWFQQYAVEHPTREQALSAWTYLEKLYSTDSLFISKQTTREMILAEKERIIDEDNAFLEALPTESYVHWYLPTRKLISSISLIAQHRPQEIPSTITALRALDYSDQRLYKSGLLKDAIEGHYWLLENSGQSLDSVYVQMNISTDLILASLSNDEAKYNEIVDFLFDLLETRSLFVASEYLALKVLTDGACTLDDDLAKQLETYRAMKKGNAAPDIAFAGEWLRNGSIESNLPENLSELNAGHKLIVFGASWCPKCAEDIPKIAETYPKWKEQGVEVIFISLDENEEDFQNFVSDFPFLSHCDFGKWNGSIVQDFYVFATPTMFLLDSSNKIVLRPNSVGQVDAWVDWYLIGDQE